MPRTNTASLPYITVVRTNSVVTFTFPTIEQPNRTTITLPEGSQWTASPHWHESYTEYIRVIKGRLRLILNGTMRDIGPNDGDQTIHKYQIHEFMRGDIEEPYDKGDKGDVIIQEWVDPADGAKEAFFRNVSSIVNDASSQPSWMGMLQITMTTAHFDNYDVFVPGKLGWLVTHAVYVVGRAFGTLLGLRPWYREYTPERLHEVASRKRSSKAKML